MSRQIITPFARIVKRFPANNRNICVFSTKFLLTAESFFHTFHIIIPFSVFCGKIYGRLMCGRISLRSRLCGAKESGFSKFLSFTYAKCGEFRSFSLIFAGFSAPFACPVFTARQPLRIRPACDFLETSVVFGNDPTVLAPGSRVFVYG